jgi:hypothetical protein
MTAASQVNFAPKYGLENWTLCPSSENLAIEYLRKLGAEILTVENKEPRKTSLQNFSSTA